MEEKKKQKGAWMHSMRTQFVTVVLVVATIIVVLYTLLIMPQVKNNIRNIYSNYLLDLSLSYGKELDEVIKETDPNLLNNPDKLKEILQDVGLEEADSAYAYLVAHDGTMLYHPTPEKIGQPVENDAVKKMVTEIESGSMPKPETVQYLFKGTKKFAACYTSENGFILVVTADDKELLASATKIELQGAGISVLLLVIGGVLAIAIVTRLTKPFVGIANSVENMARLDLRDDPLLDSYGKKGGEVGSMARSVLHMKKELCTMVSKIRAQTQEVFDRVSAGIAESISGMSAVAHQTSQLNVARNSIVDTVQNLTAIAQQNAASTQETSASMMEIGSVVQTINENAEKLNKIAMVLEESMEQFQLD